MPVLVRNVLCACQGLASTHIMLSQDGDSHVIDPRAGISVPERQLMLRLCELGWLFRSVFTAMTGCCAAQAE